MMHQMSLMQVEINNWKIAHFQYKKQIALEQCINYKIVMEG
jgi:hypothetical protein